jgi:predicted nucleotidyltransferase
MSSFSPFLSPWRKPVPLLALELPRNQIAGFCRRNHIRNLALFGSILRANFRPDSDIDVLVEFEPGHVPGLAFFTIEEELSALVGRKVDLNTPAGLSPYFRDRDLHEAVTLYGPAR